jgi:hypothetical protein
MAADAKAKADANAAPNINVQDESAHEQQRRQVTMQSVLKMKSNQSMKRMASDIKSERRDRMVMRLLLIGIVVALAVWVYRTKEDIETRYAGFIAELDAAQKAGHWPPGLEGISPFQIALCNAYPIFSNIWFNNTSTPLVFYQALRYEHMAKIVRKNYGRWLNALYVASENCFKNSTSQCSPASVICSFEDVDILKMRDLCRPQQCEPPPVNTGAAAIANETTMGAISGAFALQPLGPYGMAAGALAGFGMSLFGSIDKRDKEIEQCKKALDKGDCIVDQAMREACERL